MSTKFFRDHFLKPLKNIGPGMILLLCSCVLSPAGYTQLGHVADVRESLFKIDPQPRMFLITVIDSEDDTIGRRCQKDMEEVLFAFQEFSDWMGMEMEDPKIISGDEFSKAAVNDAIDNWLKSQEPTQIDVVVFYYSGHGFRYPGDVSPYPRMWLKTSEDRNTETTNLRIEEDIYDRIIQMGAGVNIVLSDCCNTSVAGDDGTFEEVPMPVRKRGAHKRERPKEEEPDDGLQNAEKLFVPEQPLSILATAAGKGEFAAGKTETGGFFTNFFLDALNKCIYEIDLEPTWEQVFKYVDKNASYWAKSALCPNAKRNKEGRCIQTATFKVARGDKAHSTDQ